MTANYIYTIAGNGTRGYVADNVAATSAQINNPGAVSVEQLLQVLTMLGAQVVVREAAVEVSATRPSIDLAPHAPAKAKRITRSKTAVQTADTPPACPPDDAPRGQW